MIQPDGPRHQAAPEPPGGRSLVERPMRRPAPLRRAPWAVGLARGLGRAGVRPNVVSVLSVVVAAVGCAALVASGIAGQDGDDALRALTLVIAAACAPLRVLLNMLDGMLAIEGGAGTPAGDLYNEVPDRVSDLLLLAGTGYAAVSVPGGITAGWVVAGLAVLTAHVRSLGAAQGLPHVFDGPMPRNRRMWVLTAACLASLLESTSLAELGMPRGTLLVLGLVVIGVGCLMTVDIRLQLIARALHRRARETAR